MKILKIGKQNFSEIITEVARLIKSGGIVVCPTDTVYGLICDPTNRQAMERLFRIKQRPKSKPIPVFVSNMEMAKKLAEINQKQERFLRRAWPGAVTVVLKSKNGGKTIGIRIPRHGLILEIIEKLGHPLAETSANISSEPSTTKIREVLKYFKGRKCQPDLILDGGNLKLANPSKVIDLTGSRPIILRK